jgi:DNA-directed RNA polymerase II subunit RPB2
MTIGQLLETLLGKAGCAGGYIGDGTPFQKYQEIEEEVKRMVEDEMVDEDDQEEKTKMRGILLADKIGKYLKSQGYDGSGDEPMYNGQSGELMQASIFIGPVNYMRLKHMVNDKLHARRTGPRQILTHQPVEGRSRDGGLRWGEMERDCLISHGASAVLQDRLLNNSDRYETVVCRQCGLFAEPARPQPKHHVRLLGQTSKPYCRRCKTDDHIEIVVMPYAYKVFNQDLEAFHIRMQMELVKEP